MSNEAHNRVEFLCRNAAVYTLSSSARTDQNFFDIGSEIPPKEFAKEIRIAGISDLPDESDGSENVEVVVEQRGEDEGVPKFIIYAGAGLIAILLIIIVVWQCYKCSYKRNAQGVRQKVLKLRAQGRPDSLVKAEV